MATDATDGAAIARPAPVGWRGWLQGPVVAGLVLLGIYVVASMATDHRGYLGTDTGGKVATLEAMVDDGTLDPDVGYWAEAEDPDGRVHPLYYTNRVDGRWINITTLPVVLAAYPLYAVGGYQAALLIPMLGSVAVAFAARALARRLGAGDDGWAAFWVIGLATPVAVYALDFWEHSVGLALMAWAIVVLVDVVERGPTLARGLVVGALFGAAATTRTEALVYGFVGVGLVLARLALDRVRPARLLGFAVTTLGATVVLLGANALLEAAVLGDSFRADRAGDTASGGGDQLSLRLQEAWQTTFGLESGYSARAVAVGVVAVILLVVLARRSGVGKDPAPIATVAAVGVGAIYLVRLLSGLDFVPGLFATTPFAAVGLGLAWDRSLSRLVALLALAPLPLVWLFQFTGGAGPQWGGRYVLTSGMVLAVIGVVGALRLRPAVFRYLVALSAIVTLFGVSWLAVRSADVASSAEVLVARDEPVVVSTVAHQVREYGAFYDDKLWLTAPFQGDVAFAADVVAGSGYDRFALVRGSGSPPPDLLGWMVTTTEPLDFLGTDLEVTGYERSR